MKSLGWRRAEKLQGQGMCPACSLGLQKGLRALTPQQPLIETLNKNIHQLSKEKTKGFWVPCEHSLLWEEGELLLAVPKPSQAFTWEQHQAPSGGEREQPDIPRLPLCPEALKCAGVIILFFPFFQTRMW